MKGHIASDAPKPLPGSLVEDPRKFAPRFVREHIQRFLKDIRVCLRPMSVKGNRKGAHAYMPALLTCMGLLELLSALRFGRLDLRKDALTALQDFRSDYLPAPHFRAPNLEILYIGFRHKLAHLAHPYVVFDTATDSRLAQYGRKKVTWTFHSRKRGLSAIGLHATPGRELVRTLRPWRTAYDHRLEIVLFLLARELARGGISYARDLRKSKPLRTKLMTAIEVYFPRP